MEKEAVDNSLKNPDLSKNTFFVSRYSRRGNFVFALIGYRSPEARIEAILEYLVGLEKEINKTVSGYSIDPSRSGESYSNYVGIYITLNPD